MRFTCIYLLASIPTIDHRKCAAAWHLGSAFIYLFFRILKENAERETQYQQMINHLSANVVEGTADMMRRLSGQSADI